MEYEEDDEQDIYDIAPAIDKTVSDIGKLRSMFDQKPMPIYTPGKAPPNSKFLQPSNMEPNKTAPALKPKPGPGKISMPQGFQNELQNKQQHKSNVPLPKKGNRISIENGVLVHKSNIQPPVIPRKGTTKPAPPAVKTKPMVPPKVKPDISENKATDNPDISETSKLDMKQVTENTEKDGHVGVNFDNNVDYIGDLITGPNGEQYRQVKCIQSPGPAPAKQRLPTKMDIDDILQQYAEDEDMYDDVLAEDPNNRVSVIPEWTEEEEQKLAAEAKQNKTEEFEQEEYDDVRVSRSDRTNKSLSLMSTGSDIYETFDEVADVKL